jgi:hypothetical protein
VNRSDVVISICPPHAAIDVARQVALIRSDGFLYVDANTIAPVSIREIAGQFGPNVVVDVALTEAPGADNLTIWISGERRAEVSELSDGTRISCRTVGGDIGQASELISAK